VILDKIFPSWQTDADVSSQEDSMAKIEILNVQYSNFKIIDLAKLIEH
jgi:hypothetical protein